MCNHNLLQLVSNPIDVTVDYRMSAMEMIDLGNYDFVDKSIRLLAERVSPLHNGKIVRASVMLIRCRRAITTDSAVKQLAKLSFVPAPPEHLFALGASILISKDYAQSSVFVRFFGWNSIASVLCRTSAGVIPWDTICCWSGIGLGGPAIAALLPCASNVVVYDFLI